MQALDYALLAVLAILVAGHIGILFIADLNRFLVAENIVLALLYIVGAIGVVKGLRWGYALVTVVALFSAGRVSRSIVGLGGEIGELAIQHIPLLALDLVAGLLAFAAIY
ncbi:MAG: hypothetical protein ABWW69_06165 [Pyrodictiaceae archaeon]